LKFRRFAAKYYHLMMMMMMMMMKSLKVISNDTVE